LSSYVATSREVDTLPLIRHALTEGKDVLVPVVKTHSQLVFSSIKDPDKELAPGRFSILEPKEEYMRIRSLNEAQLVLVPGLAWDLKGYRVGHGYGYYDRALDDLNSDPLKVGLAFDFQIVDSLPHTSRDVPVDVVVSERRVIRRHP
jgi:5-formyltetrahydrofolate cyclo-ligase